MQNRLLTNGGELKAVVGKAGMPTLDMSYTQTGAIPYCAAHQQKEPQPLDWSCTAPTEVARPADIGVFECADNCCVPPAAAAAAAAAATATTTAAAAATATAAAAASTSTGADDVRVRIPFPVCKPATTPSPAAPEVEDSLQPATVAPDITVTAPAPDAGPPVLVPEASTPGKGVDGGVAAGAIGAGNPPLHGPCTPTPVALQQQPCHRQQPAFAPPADPPSADHTTAARARTTPSLPPLPPHRPHYHHHHHPIILSFYHR